MDLDVYDKIVFIEPDVDYGSNQRTVLHGVGHLLTLQSAT